MTCSNARLSMRETIADATRLLHHLMQPESRAIATSPAADDIVLSRMRKGISLGRGTVSPAAASLLIERGLLRADGQGAFVLTEAGRQAAHKLPARTDEHMPFIPAACSNSPKVTSPKTATAKASRSRAGHPGRAVGEAVLHGRCGASTVRINEAESPLAWLHRRRDRDGEPFIDATCFEAGERLRRDMTMAGIMPRVTSRWSPVGGGNGGPAAATDAMVAARQRLDRALDAVDGDYAGILLDVCGFLKRIEDVERERRWPPRSGKVVLKLALQRLAAHYGIANVARGEDNARHIRSWKAG
ncbi:DUF6456 domain-containing protein [Pseudochelatococcus contaminans]|uniref:DUF6456 domain-containing protein n=1 Tax=Pseudochelatococcus contaminans TaxID=1538103 RepID=A0A7W6EEU7_9HYPH|nr:DUF6456 domain-containing protein [Pseudochelatococcus contaminans]MBB3808386.1 hypothetical protein [Pseudochelatococcus contaminans]